MRWLRVLLAATLLVLPVWVVTALPADACSCAGSSTQEKVDDADLILVGTAQGLRAIGPPPTPEPMSPPDDSLVWVPGEVPIAVEEYLKGAGPETVALDTPAVVLPGSNGEVVLPLLGGTCSVLTGAGALGDRYLLFLFARDDGRYETSTCAGSTAITPENEAQVSALIDEVRQILAGPAPTATVSASAFPDSGVGGSGSGTSPWLAAAAGGGGVVLASAALFAFRRTKAGSPS